MEDHSALVSLLKKETIEFHTFTAPTARPVRLVAKGLPVAMTTLEIQEDLNTQGLQPIKVTQLYQNKNAQKISLPLFLVEFPPATDPTEIRAVRHICRIIITWDTYRRPKGPTQCMRCQQIGHGTSNCMRNPRCVKCAGQHLTSACTREKNATSPPKCVNCGGEHPASYKGCKVYKEHNDKHKKSRKQPIGKNNNKHDTVPKLPFLPSDFPRLTPHATPQHTAATIWPTATQRHPDASQDSATSSDNHFTSPLLSSILVKDGLGHNRDNQQRCRQEHCNVTRPHHKHLLPIAS
ncbi:hypothetical protein B566_EDAN018502 [Ephemera danica]|nr:hypothetical protein B566_EDAN018502 [Ephemera danica]